MTSPKTYGCEQVAELLPWYLADSLDSNEFELVDRHLATCAACRGEVRDVAATWELLDVHAPSHDLVAVALGLESEDWTQDEVEAHLAVCPHCCAEFDSVLEAEAEFDREIEAPVEAANVIPFRGPAVSARRVALPLAIAAAFLLAAPSVVRLSTPGVERPHSPATNTSVTASMTANGLDAQPTDTVLSQDAFELGLGSQWKIVAGAQPGQNQAIHTQDFESTASLVVVRKPTSRDQT